MGKIVPVPSYEGYKRMELNLPFFLMSTK